MFGGTKFETPMLVADWTSLEAWEAQEVWFSHLNGL
jgi:hypothetical protein